MVPFEYFLHPCIEYWGPQSYPGGTSWLKVCCVPRSDIHPWNIWCMKKFYQFFIFKIFLINSITKKHLHIHTQTHTQTQKQKHTITLIIQLTIYLGLCPDGPSEISCNCSSGFLSLLFPGLISSHEIQFVVQFINLFKNFFSILNLEKKLHIHPCIKTNYLGLVPAPTLCCPWASEIPPTSSSGILFLETGWGSGLPNSLGDRFLTQN